MALLSVCSHCQSVNQRGLSPLYSDRNCPKKVNGTLPLVPVEYAAHSIFGFSLGSLSVYLLYCHHHQHYGSQSTEIAKARLGGDDPAHVNSTFIFLGAERSSLNVD
ncbi:hypothetical protein ACMFMG_011197 [Clarireedia jacksonii]